MLENVWMLGMLLLFPQLVQGIYKLHHKLPASKYTVSGLVDGHG